MDMIASRVWRILRKMNRYREAGPSDTERLSHLLTHSERVFGAYVNPEGTPVSEIIISSKGLYLIRPGQEIWHIEYRRIANISLGEAQKASRSLTITERDGTEHIVDVAGGEGKFRDTFGLWRFLARVTEDIEAGRIP